MGDSGHAGAIPPPELRIVEHGLWQVHGDAARLRCGVFGNVPVAAVVADRGVMVADVDSGDVILESTAPEGTVFLDVAISEDGIYGLTGTGEGFVVDRLLGSGSVDRLRLALPPAVDGDYGALAIVDGTPHALIHQDELVYCMGTAEAVPVLARANEDVLIEGLDILAAPGRERELFGAAFLDNEVHLGGGLLDPREPGWSAKPLHVEHGDLEEPQWSSHWLADVWLGMLHGAPVVAHPGVASIQIRHLRTGELLAARILGDGLMADFDGTPVSVAFLGDLAALLFADRLEVRDWQDFSLLDRRPLGPRSGNRAVRLVEAQGRVWVVAANSSELAFDRVRSPRPLSTRRTEVPRNWSSVTVSEGSEAIAGIDPEGRALLLGGRWNNWAPECDDGPLHDSPLQLGDRRWKGVSLGHLETVERLGLWSPDAWAVTYAMPEIDDRIKAAGTDPVEQVAFGGRGSYVVLAYGTVAEPEGDGLEPRWSEGDPVVRLAVPGKGTGVYARAPLAVVAVDRMGEWGKINLRDTETGRLVAEQVTDALIDISAAWGDGVLWIAALTGPPRAVRVFRWDQSTLSAAHQSYGDEGQSVAIAVRGGVPVVALATGTALSLFDGRDGAPLGRAQLDSVNFVLVEGPLGTEFLAGDEVVALVPVSDPGAEREHGPLRPPDLKAGDLSQRHTKLPGARPAVAPPREEADAHADRDALRVQVEAIHDEDALAAATTQMDRPPWDLNDDEVDAILAFARSVEGKSLEDIASRANDGGRKAFGAAGDVGESVGGLQQPLELPEGLPDETRESLTCWQEAGLHPTFIPVEFAGMTYPVGEWAWGLGRVSDSLESGEREPVVDPLAAYLQFPELERFLAGDWRPRFLVCHAGQGVNSYGINYVIITGRLALFAQAGWGGVYMDEASAADDVNRIGELLAEAYQAASAITSWPRGRLVVVDSTFRGSRPAAWVPSPGQEPDPVPGDLEEGLRGAIQYLRRVAESP